MLSLENRTIICRQLITSVCSILWSSEYVFLCLLLLVIHVNHLNGNANLCIWRCTDGESCKRQIAEDFQNERPLWKLTCYGHNKKYVHVVDCCHYAKILFYILLFWTIFFNINESCYLCLFIFDGKQKLGVRVWWHLFDLKSCFCGSVLVEIKKEMYKHSFIRILWCERNVQWVGLESSEASGGI